MSETKGKHTPRCPKCKEQQLEFGLGSDLVGWLGIVRCKSGKCTGEYAFYDIEDWTDFAQFFPHEQLVAALREWLSNRKLMIAAGGTKGPLSQDVIQQFALLQERAVDLSIAALRAAGEDVE